ncbi:SAM-dependent methyltransferase [Streptomyces sp. NPDC059788]|uniref:SAM-dependent methyltransferase n=1 Tax=Streptomyces sp. NPDC059788 TaxID=3346948 RepID=UPI003668CF82
MTSPQAGATGHENPEDGIEVDAEYFRTWADSRPTISCALWEAPGEPDPGTDSAPGREDRTAAEHDDLERAQERKLRTIARLAGVRPGMDVLDIGCGFGGMLEHLVGHEGVRSAHGIESSAPHCREIRSRGTSRVSVDCLDYADFRPHHLFDAVVSISMIEHLAGVWAPEPEAEVRALRDFFRRTHRWTRAGAGLALEVVITGPRGMDAEQAKEGSQSLEGAGEPPGSPPALPNVLAAADGLWEPRSVRTHRQDWVRTLDVWIARAQAARAAIDARWGASMAEQTRRCLRLEREQFAAGGLSVAHLSFRRVGEEVAGARTPPP